MAFIHYPAARLASSPCRESTKDEPGCLMLSYEGAFEHRASIESFLRVAVEIFTQFGVPAERTMKWVGMLRTLKPGGLLMIQGYTLSSCLMSPVAPSMCTSTCWKAILS